MCSPERIVADEVPFGLRMKNDKNDSEQKANDKNPTEQETRPFGFLFLLMFLFDGAVMMG